jgi:hypothetical protein
MTTLVSRELEFIVPMRPLPFSQTIRIATTCAVFLVISWAAVTLRLYTRVNFVRSLGWDDGWIAWSLVGVPMLFHKESSLTWPRYAILYTVLALYISMS